MTDRSPYVFVMAIASCILLGALLVVASAALLQKPDAKPAAPKPAAPKTVWYYGKHTVAPTAQKGVVVDCVERTNSVKFGNREYAKPGDVYQFTCRARRAS